MKNNRHNNYDDRVAQFVVRWALRVFCGITISLIATRFGWPTALVYTAVLAATMHASKTLD